MGYRPFCTIYTTLRSPPRGILPFCFKSRQSHMYSTYLILLPRDRNRTRRGSKTRVRDLHECAYPSLKERRSDRSTRPIGAQTKIRMHIWGHFAEDGEESSVVVWARRKEGRSGRVWMEELGWTSVFLTNFDAIPRSLADWRDAGCEFFLRLMSSFWCR